MPAAALAIRTGDDGRQRAVLSGDWTLASLPAPIAALEASLHALNTGNALWDLRAVVRLDSVSAVLFWRAWGRRWPARSRSRRRIGRLSSAMPRFVSHRNRRRRGRVWRR